MLIGTGHGPTNSLRTLGAKVAGDGEKVGVPGAIQHRQLAAARAVAGVVEYLTHQIDQRPITRHQQALLTIAREEHVVFVMRHGLGDRNGLFTSALHIEAGFPLTLTTQHGVVKSTRQEHITQALPQGFRA